MTLNLQCINLKRKKTHIHMSERKAIRHKTFSFYFFFWIPLSPISTLFLFLPSALIVLCHADLWQMKLCMREEKKHTEKTHNSNKVSFIFPVARHVQTIMYCMCNVYGWRKRDGEVLWVFVHRLRCKYTFSKWYTKS